MSASVQDRTSEFRAVLQLEQRKIKSRKPKSRAISVLQPRALWGGDNKDEQSDAKQPLLADADVSSSVGPTDQSRREKRSEFGRKAAAIAHGISATVTKLDRLGQLARQRSLFDDSGPEIQRLTETVKSEIDVLSKAIATLQASVVTKQPTGLFSSANGQMSQDERTNNTKVVAMLQESLVGVGGSFRSVLEVRTKNMQATSSRTANLIAAGGTGNAGLYTSDDLSNSPLFSKLGRAQSTNGRTEKTAEPNVSATVEEERDLLSLDMPVARPASTSHQMMLMEEGQTSHEYLQRRGEAMAAIESTIQDLGVLFSQLAGLVQIQGEQIQRIDANTEEVVENVAGAYRELTKYWKRVNSNRWLIAKMTGVLMVFFVLWVFVSG